MRFKSKFNYKSKESFIQVQVEDSTLGKITECSGMWTYYPHEDCVEHTITDLQNIKDLLLSLNRVLLEDEK